MIESLLVSASLMGLAGTPHCLAMCGPACGALGGPWPWRFHLARLLSYSAGGALAAASVTTLGALGQALTALRPLWTLVHVAALALGLYLLWQGRQPVWMERRGAVRPVVAPVRLSKPGMPSSVLTRSSLAGLGWVAWPCGLLQSALLVAALANNAWHGALVMASFAFTSALGLMLGPAVWWRLLGQQGGTRAQQLRLDRWAVRFAGAALAAGSAWALGHGLWMRVLAWCLS